jgi:hypothetical protein
MNLRILAVSLCFFLVLFSLGYTTSLAKEDADMDKTPLLEPSAMLKFSDVPVPAGFKILSEKSYSFESPGGMRVGVLKYQGKANPDQVVNFYKDQMPMYNWSLLNVVEYGERLLNFERENETCIISLLSKGKRVTITISLGPKSQILPAKSAKPVK